MKSLPVALILLAFCSLAHAGSLKQKLLGKWTSESGQGATKIVTTLEFTEKGDYSKTGSLGTRVMTTTMGGRWLLTTDATGAKALFADPNKLILTYKTFESGRMVDKTEAYLVIISNDATFGGKETLRLAPLDGSLLGTNYYFRAK